MLNRLGAEFAAYLAATRPTGNDNLWLDFLVDLARLEWCFSEVFDGPGPESQEILRVETLCRIPADQWPACRLAPVAGLRLLTFDYPVHELYRALRRREPLVLPVARQTHLVVWRRDFIVRHDELTDMQFGLLAALVQGHTIGQAIEEAARQACDIPMLSQNLAAWFQIWFGAGLFDRVLH
jgi:hypothetical protein